MKILMLCQRLPFPPTKGEKIRAFHHLRFLGREHEVTLLTLAEGVGELAHAGRLRELTADIEVVPIALRRAKLKGLLALPLGTPMTLRYFDAPSLRERVRTRLARASYDLIFVYSSAMAQYVEEVHDSPIVVDFVDMDSHKWLQYARRAGFPLSLLYRIEGERMKAYERRVAGLADMSVVVSPAEAALFQAVAPGAPVAVVPMVVDTEYFSPDGGPPAGPPTLLFSGVMDYFPNVDGVRYFAREIFPRISREMPAARLLIVGQRPTRDVRRLGRLPGIEVTGPVPDVRPYFGQAQVAVAPLRVAQGMQTKILEAMAMGLPVVATSRAYTGLEARPGEHLFVEDDPARFADIVVGLLRAPDLRLRVGRAARAFVEVHHAWTASMATLDRVLADATRSRRVPAGLLAGGCS